MPMNGAVMKPPLTAILDSSLVLNLICRMREKTMEME